MDYYDILSVKRDASSEEIRIAFHRKAMKFHPDISVYYNAAEMFKLVNEAYTVLRDEDKRKEYNVKLMGELFQTQIIDPVLRQPESIDHPDDKWWWRRKKG